MNNIVYEYEYCEFTFRHILDLIDSNKTIDQITYILSPFVEVVVKKYNDDELDLSLQVNKKASYSMRVTEFKLEKHFDYFKLNVVKKLKNIQKHIDKAFENSLNCYE